MKKKIEHKLTKKNGRFNIIEDDETFGMIEVVTSKHQQFIMYDFAVERDSFKFNFLKKYMESNEKQWEGKGVDCWCILKDGEEIIDLLPIIKEETIY